MDNHAKARLIDEFDELEDEGRLWCQRRQQHQFQQQRGVAGERARGLFMGTVTFCWVNCNDLTATKPWESLTIRKIIPKWP